MSRVTGRTIIPTDIAEAAVLQELGLKTLRVPRRVNPYQVARRLRRATSPHPDLEYLRSIAVRTHLVPSRSEELDKVGGQAAPAVVTTQDTDVEVAAE